MKLNARNRWCLAGLLLVLLATALVRLRLAPMALERDEGEYAYAGQLILDGVAPFKSVYSMKPPGTSILYALGMKLFGETPFGIHLLLLVVSLANIVFVFVIASEILDPLAGLFTALFFACLTLDFHSFGFSANTEPFVLFFALSGVILLAWAERRARAPLYFATGFLFGLAFICKQPALAFLLGALTVVILRDLRRKALRPKEYAWLSLGGMAPFLFLMLWAWACGGLGKFWFWTVRYAVSYGGEITLEEGFLRYLPETFLELIRGTYAIWVLAFLGIFAISRWDDRRKKDGFLAFLVASLVALSAGFYFRQHYFLFLSPCIALLAAATIDRLRAAQAFSRGARKLIPDALVVVSLLLFVIAESGYLFTWSPAVTLQRAYFPNPFREAPAVGDFLRSRCERGDTVAILGSEPEIYFYSHCRSVTSYVYTYPLVEPHPFALEMQKEMIKQIETARPTYLLYMNESLSWLQQPGFSPMIFEWISQYLLRYQLVGLQESGTEAPGRFWQGDIPEDRLATSVPSIRIFRLNEKLR